MIKLQKSDLRTAGLVLGGVIIGYLFASCDSGPSRDTLKSRLDACEANLANTENSLDSCQSDRDACRRKLRWQ